MIFNFFSKKEPKFPKDLPVDHIRVWQILDANPDDRKKLFSIYALCAACKTGDKDAAEYLLAHEKTPPSGMIGLGDAPLYAAIDAHRADMVQLLKEYGVNLHAWDLDKHDHNMADDIRAIIFKSGDEPEEPLPPKPPHATRPLSDLGVWRDMHADAARKKEYIGTLALGAAITRYGEYARKDDAAVVYYLLYREKIPARGAAGLDHMPMAAAVASGDPLMIALLKKHGAIDIPVHAPGVPKPV